ncbi:hypothetical protein E4U36_003952 [Claviceps purpurea]|nr:hypothetical protein E4U51_008382 [Claviceps purpurea]KAG6181603.1 hypothetical protein E4U36_003952 [Claviceps purpurea]
MKSFLTTAPSAKRQLSPDPQRTSDGDDEPTEVKLALLSSLHAGIEQETLLDFLLAHNGSVLRASEAIQLGKNCHEQEKKSSIGIGYQQSLRQYATLSRDSTTPPTRKKKKTKTMSKRGTTLHLYDPEDVAEHTPCTIIHNFLRADEANELLKELLHESKSFEKNTFKLFDNVVSSPHTSSFFVESSEELTAQKSEYYYNGSQLTDVRRITPQLAAVKPKVQDAVNKQIQHRIETRYPSGKKLRYQSPNPWIPNSAFVNCYDGAQQNVGWHSDQLTYLGPRAVIGSISLGVAREFRVRRVVPKDGGGGGGGDTSTEVDADAEGQISIHLPHNSLLVMHAEMQEEWKHCVTPAPSIDPHPIAGNKRINITYRDYKPRFHPRFTPRCACKVPCVMRVVQKKRENFGKYFWMCHAGNVPGKQGCSFFQWAEFDDDGNPVELRKSRDGKPHPP